MKDIVMRELVFSNEFWSFYNAQQERVKRKFDYVMAIVREERVLTTRFVKRIETADLYEMRVSVGTNEYRTVLFAVDNDNIINATRILVLNAFLKHSSKDYKAQIEKALKILGGYEK